MRFLGICLLGLGLAVSAAAGEIKAIVNDTPISAFDVDARAKMMLFQRSGTVGKLTRSLRQEALEDLVDERLKMQEADKRRRGRNCRSVGEPGTPKRLARGRISGFTEKEQNPL